MRRRLVIVLGFALVLFTLAPVVMAGHGAGNGAHTASLSGESEVPSVDTDAAGNAVVKFRGDNDSLFYVLTVNNIVDVVAAHIHCAPPGVNGPVGVTLFSLFGGDPTSASGLLAKATVMAPDSGNGCGWETLADVAEAIDGGNAYVNVHTLANPTGEIRGQLG